MCTVTVMRCYCLELRSTINSEGTSSQEIHCKLAPSTAATKALEKILKCLDVFMLMYLCIKTVLLISATHYGSKN